MPPKRKTAFSVTDDSPTKRRTRSSGVLLLDTSLPRPSTPKTYGRKSGTSSITETSTNPRKECKDVEEGNREESSEDELNLSPSRFPGPLPSSPSSRKSMSSVVEVTIVTKRRAANSDVGGPPVSPATKQKLPAEKALRTSRTHLKSPVRNAEALFSPPSCDKIPAMLTNDLDPSEQDDSDSGKRPLLSVTKSAKFVPSTEVGFTPSLNLRKRRENPNEFSLQPSPKKPKAATVSRTPELSSTTRQASPVRIMDNSRSPSPIREYAGSASTPASPSKRRPSHKQTHLAQGLLPHLHPCLNGQKRAILRALHQHPEKGFWGDEDEESEDDEIATNEIAFQQLTEVLNGTVTRGEGNSCLLLGPRGSGKTTLVEQCISNLSAKPHIIRLSGWTQTSDRLAMREIAYQLGKQTGNFFLSQKDDVLVDDDNPFLEASPSSTSELPTISLPPSSQLPGLISLLPTLSQSTLVILDGFDLFALHPRQSLLYCLLDTVQSCRAGAQGKGLAVIGITSRMDTINILEKRVKSRFSGRMIRIAPPKRPRDWVKFVKAVLLADFECVMSDKDVVEEWRSSWEAAVQNFLTNKATLDILDETFSITRDIRMLSRLLISLTAHISPASPFPSVSQFASAAALQRSRPRFAFLYTLSYPSLCLLIASVHADTAGHSIFTFEMLHEYFRDQVRASMSAPVQVNGGSIGMVRCSREVLMTAFEHLITMQIFLSVTPLSPSIAKEFLKYRCRVDRAEVKKAIETTGQVNLKKWLTKAQ